MNHEVSHAIAFLDGGEQGGVEIQSVLALQFEGDQIPGVDERRQVELQVIERRAAGGIVGSTAGTRQRAAYLQISLCERSRRGGRSIRRPADAPHPRWRVLSSRAVADVGEAFQPKRPALRATGPPDFLTVGGRPAHWRTFTPVGSAGRFRRRSSARPRNRPPPRCQPDARQCRSGAPMGLGRGVAGLAPLSHSTKGANSLGPAGECLLGVVRTPGFIGDEGVVLVHVAHQIELVLQTLPAELVPTRSSPVSSCRSSQPAPGSRSWSAWCRSRGRRGDHFRPPSAARAGGTPSSRPGGPCCASAPCPRTRGRHPGRSRSG